MERKLQMRAMKDTVAGWISSEQQQPGQLSWGGGEGGTQYMCVGWGCFLFFLGGVGGGVRPEDSDYILRPIQGDWGQDCKPKHYLCCSST